MSPEKWAVENVSPFGVVRLIECHKRAVAQSIADLANNQVSADGDTYSRVVAASSRGGE